MQQPLMKSPPALSPPHRRELHAEKQVSENLAAVSRRMSSREEDSVALLSFKKKKITKKGFGPGKAKSNRMYPPFYRCAGRSHSVLSTSPQATSGSLPLSEWLPDLLGGWAVEIVSMNSLRKRILQVSQGQNEYRSPPRKGSQAQPTCRSSGPAQDWI